MTANHGPYENCRIALKCFHFTIRAISSQMSVMLDRERINMEIKGLFVDLASLLPTRPCTQSVLYQQIFIPATCHKLWLVDKQLRVKMLQKGT